MFCSGWDGKLFYSTLALFVFQADTTGTLYRKCFMVCTVILEAVNITRNISNIVTGGFVQFES